MTADAPGRVGRRTGATGAFRTGSHKARREARDFGPYDAEDLDPAAVPDAGLVDFGSVRVPVPDGGTVTVEPTANGRLQAVHVTMPGGRLSVSALAAPRSSELWPELVAEIDSSLRDGGARVRSFQGEWGRELHARTGAANSVFIGVNGARWMLYGVATGPATYAVELEAALRTMLKCAVVDRGRSPYPVRTVLPLVVPEHLAVVDGVDEAPPAPRAAPARTPARTPARAVPEASRAARPVPPRVAPSPVQPVSADATQALPVRPRVAAQARRRPVTPPRPVPREVAAEPPTPLWAAAPGPVSGADLGRDPADDVSVDRPLNDVVTPTEWWPAISAEPAAGPAAAPDPWAGPGRGVDDGTPATERWPVVPSAGPPSPVSPSPVSPSPVSPSPVSPSPPLDRSDDGAPTEWWPAVPARDDGYRSDPAGPVAAGPAADEPVDGETFYAELRFGRASYVEPAVSELVSFESLDSEPVDARLLESEPFFADMLEARRRPAPEIREERAEPTGRRRAPEGPAPAGGRRRAPDAPTGPQPGGGRRRAPEPQAPGRPAPGLQAPRLPAGATDEARLADDTLDLAALVRERSGRRRARYEAEHPTPDAPRRSREPRRTHDEPAPRPGGRRRAPEPTGPPPGAGGADVGDVDVTAPLPVVTPPAPGRHGRGDPEPDWANSWENGTGPALAFLPTTPPRNPGRHHRPS